MNKLQSLLLFTAAIILSFSSCEKEEALTTNPNFIPTATGDDPDGDGVPGNSGGSGNGGNTGGGGQAGLPSGFLADTNITNRAALLEDFTGVRCQFCPDGHDRAEAAKSSLGEENFIILAVHGGIYASPNPGWKNFTTSFFDAIKNQALVSGYPAGTISRIKADSLGVAPQQPGGYAMSRTAWNSAASAVVNNMVSPVNIGAKATIDGSNNLTVDVDLYYSAEENEMNNINVALVQDSLISTQYLQGNIPDTNYYQNNVLRHLITGQWGETISAKSKGDIIQKTYTYTVPSDYNGTGPEGGGEVVIDHLKVVVFVARGQTDVLNVVEVDVE